MNYNLLMESWRKFLKEKDSFPLRPYDPMSGEERQYDPEAEEKFQRMKSDYFSDVEAQRKAEKEKEEEDDFNRTNINDSLDMTYPFLTDDDGNRVNFINPTNTGLVSGRFNQGRSMCVPAPGSNLKPTKIYHNAIDVYGTKGEPFLAVAEGTIIQTVSDTDYNLTVQNLARRLIKRANKIAIDSKNVEQIKKELSEVENWDDIRSIQKAYLKRGSVSRYIRATGIVSTGGMSVTMITDPDQYGRRWKIYGCHLDKVNKTSGRVSAGEVLGICGNSSIADSKPHLHLEVWTSQIDGLRQSSVREKIFRDCRKRGYYAAEPKAVFPKLKGSKSGQGIYQNN